MKLIRGFLFVLCLAISAVLVAGIGYDIYTHTGPGTGALSSKATVELVLLGILSLVFLKWSRDLWLKLRRPS